MTISRCAGPYFDELSVGDVFDTAPSMTLTDGVAAVHQAILGDRLRLPLDAGLSAAVTREAGAPVAHPGLVCDIAIGQSTAVTYHVKANLFYRGLAFHRYPHIGDTLSTRTEVVALRDNAAKPGRGPTGLVALRVTTVDQHARIVLDFHRCAMLPVSPRVPSNRAIHTGDMSSIGGEVDPLRSIPAWDPASFRQRIPGPHFSRELVGREWSIGGDVVTSAPELARLTLNVAAVHHDQRVSGQRLVYGGHTIGIALAQAVRALPNIVTVLNWHSCEHTGPVREGDTLTSQLRVDSVHPLDDGQGAILHLHSQVSAHSNDVARAVLSWKFDVLLY